jgi:crotonobetainyl-CoA:carnitine CoA-transferase CaiB-like acyl-CoA transferase
MDQVFEDPQVQHNQMEQLIEHSTLGTIRQVGSSIRAQRFRPKKSSVMLPF